jgi:WhiB family transcriptional regulator, redox-sensing transcriptional regulator
LELLDLPTAGHDYHPDEYGFMSRGSCRAHDPRMWDTVTTRNGTTAIRGKSLILAGKRVGQAEVIVRAKRVCEGCPVRLECQSFIERYPEDEGIWAGLLPEERAAMKRERDKGTHAVEEALAAYRLELEHGTDHTNALRNAVTAAVGSYEVSVIKEVAQDAIWAAEIMDEDGGDIADDGVAALLWFARELQESVPMDDRDA